MEKGFLKRKNPDAKKDLVYGYFKHFLESLLKWDIWVANLLEQNIIIITLPYFCTQVQLLLIAEASNGITK